MCGVFGFISKGERGPDLRRLENIARATETRGRHAFGFAWIDGAGHLRMFKQTGRISDYLGVLAMARHARFLVGHCRFATNGNPEFNINNHPHPVDGGWLVHNGVIGNYADLVCEHDLAPVSKCDSEVIGLLMETMGGAMVDRMLNACHLAKTGSMAVLGLWKSPHRLLALRSGNPLHLGGTQNGWYLGSLIAGMPKESYMLRDNTILEFKADKQGAVDYVAYDAAEMVAV